MKATLFATMLSLISALAGQEDSFQSIKEDYLGKAKLLEELDRIMLTDLKIEDRSLEEAIVLL